MVLEDVPHLADEASRCASRRFCRIELFLETRLPVDRGREEYPAERCRPRVSAPGGTPYAGGPVTLQCRRDGAPGRVDRGSRLLSRPTFRAARNSVAVRQETSRPASWARAILPHLVQLGGREARARALPHAPENQRSRSSSRTNRGPAANTRSAPVDDESRGRGIRGERLLVPPRERIPRGAVELLLGLPEPLGRIRPQRGEVEHLGQPLTAARHGLGHAEPAARAEQYVTKRRPATQHDPYR